MRKRLSIVAVFLVLSALAWPSIAQPAPQAPAVAWADRVYRWHYNPEHHPAWLTPDQARDLVQRAARKWEACGVRMEYLGETRLRPGVIDGENVVGWNPDLPPGVRGLTQGRSSAGAILERDIAFAPGRPEFERNPRLLEKVLVHEFGHAIGLRHSPVCDDVMTLASDCPGALPALPPLEPTENDLRRCRLLYPDSPR